MGNENVTLDMSKFSGENGLQKFIEAVKEVAVIVAETGQDEVHLINTEKLEDGKPTDYGCFEGEELANQKKLESLVGLIEGGAWEQSYSKWV